MGKPRCWSDAEPKSTPGEITVFHVVVLANRNFARYIADQLPSLPEPLFGPGARLGALQARDSLTI
jgi:hypothetical protein